MLSQLYRSSTKTQQELKAKQKKLREQNEAYEAEREQFESSLSGILKSSGSGGTARDNEVSATMALADVKLEELHKEINDRLDKGEKLGDTEPDYYFAWPVPGAYSVSSGVGARWGSYHTGLDIPAAHGISSFRGVVCFRISRLFFCSDVSFFYLCHQLSKLCFLLIVTNERRTFFSRSLCRSHITLSEKTLALVKLTVAPKRFVSVTAFLCAVKKLHRPFKAFVEIFQQTKGEKHLPIAFIEKTSLEVMLCRNKYLVCLRNIT